MPAWAGKRGMNQIICMRPLQIPKAVGFLQAGAPQPENKSVATKKLKFPTVRIILPFLLAVFQRLFVFHIAFLFDEVSQLAKVWWGECSPAAVVGGSGRMTLAQRSVASAAVSRSLLRSTFPLRFAVCRHSLRPLGEEIKVSPSWFNWGIWFTPNGMFGASFDDRGHIRI